MKLAKFLNSLFIKNGFILIDADSNKYKIGNPKKEKPITLRLLDRSLHSNYFFTQIFILEKLTQMDQLLLKMDH